MFFGKKWRVVMKKDIVLFLLLILYLFFIFGCFNKNVTDNYRVYVTHHELKNAPDWVKTPYYKKGISAKGSQEIVGFKVDSAKKNAILSAKNSLAKTIQIKVFNIIKYSAQSTNVGADAIVDLSNHVSMQTSYQLLNSARHADTWISPSGKLYALIAIRLDTAKKIIKQNIHSYFSHERDLHQQLQAVNFFYLLDKKIEKEFTN